MSNFVLCITHNKGLAPVRAMSSACALIMGIGYIYIYIYIYTNTYIYAYTIIALEKSLSFTYITLSNWLIHFMIIWKRFPPYWPLFVESTGNQCTHTHRHTRPPKVCLLNVLYDDPKLSVILSRQNLKRESNVTVHYDLLTHWGRWTHICVNKSYQHWFR